MSKHTMGEWYAGRTDMRSYLGDGTPVHYVYRGCDETAESRIRVLPYPGGNGDPLPDALIVAAAPGLLQAAQLALLKCSFPVGAVKAKEALEAAIAAAEGRA